MFDNQKEIDEINQQIKSIDNNLSLGRIGIYENKAISVGLIFKQKGNKDIIEKLKLLGFEIISREKIRTFKDDGYASTRYQGYEMSVTLQKELK